jgi:glycosyltransferase involved in cell wall biosynthesis
VNKQRPDIRDYAVVYFGNDWFGENRTSSHHIARRLAAVTDVLYIDTPGIRAPRAQGRDFRKLWRKLLAALEPPRKVQDRLHVMTLLQIPFRRLPFISSINRILGRFLVRRAAAKLGFGRRISWFTVVHPGMLAGTLGEEATVYYCTDDHAAFPGVDRKTIQPIDDHLTRVADIVFVAPPKLLAAKKELNPNSHYWPHGVDAEMFAKASDPAVLPAPPARELKHPVIGYFGNIGEWLDYDLLLKLARAHPDWTFLFVGFAAADITSLKACANVVFAGPQPYETLPLWARAFDVAIIPFVMSPRVTNANLLKLREYLACGKPVVTVRVPETDRFAEVVYVADEYPEFLRAIETALAEDTPQRIQLRQQAGSGVTWDARFRDTIAAVERTLGSSSKAAAEPA